STQAATSTSPRAAVQPINGGIAPGKAPTAVEREVRVFNGVYKKRYPLITVKPSTAVSTFTDKARYNSAPVVSATPNHNASNGNNLPEGSGRPSVRRIRPSRSRSINWLSVAMPDESRAM